MIRASDIITLVRVNDGAKGATGATGATGKGVKSNIRYYCLQASSTKPSKPTTNPPASTWTKTEPSYTTGSTRYLYTVDLTVYTDNSFLYSDVSLSSSYEAAKAAYAKAVNAQTEIVKTNEQVALRATKNEVTETLKGYATTAEMNAAITVKADSITQTVSETYTTKTDFNNLQIGGTNYVLNSSFLGCSNDGIYTFSGDEVTFSASSTGIQSGVYFNLLASNDFCKPARNNKVTLSIEYKIESTLTNGTTNPWCGAQLSVVRDSTTGGSTQWLSNIVNETVISNRWLKRSATFTITDYDIASAHINIYFRDIKGTIKFRHPKLEIGNKATDWSPAPEDAGTRIGSLETRVTQTESQWSVTAAKVNGMYTGGQNLLKKHNFATGKWCGENPRGTWTDFPDWQQPLFSSSYGFVRNATSGNGISIGSITGVSLAAWGDYTLSFSAYCDSPSGEWTETQDIYARVFRTTEYSDRLEKKVTLHTGVRRFQFTFNTGATVINGGIDFISWENGSTQSLKYKVSIGDIMLVKSTTPAEWCPNEWDGAKTTTVTVDHTGMYVNTEGVVEFNTNKFSVSPPDGNDQLFSVSASDHTVRAQRGYFDGYLYAPNMATRTTSACKYINVGGSGDYPTIQAAWDSLPEVCGEVHFMVNADAPGTAYLRGKYVSFLAIYGNGGTYNIGNVYAWGMHGRFTDVIMSNNGNPSSNACQLYASVLNFERVKFASSGRALQAFNSCRISMYGCSMTGIGSYTYMQNACIDLYGSNININNVTGRGQITGLYLADGSLAVIKGTCCGPTINAAGGHVIGDYSLDGATVEKPTVSTSSAFSASTCVTWQSTYGSTWKKITSSVGTKVESRHSTTSSGFDYRAGWWVLDTGTAIKTALSGKTISKATVTIKRNDVWDDTRKCHLCYHSKTVTNTLNGNTDSTGGLYPITKFGEFTEIGSYNLNPSSETVITLPSSVYTKLQDGTIKGFGLIDNGTDWKQIMCDNTCTLTVTYT